MNFQIRSGEGKIMKSISDRLMMLAAAGAADALSECQKQEELKAKSEKISVKKQTEKQSEEELMGEEAADSKWMVNGARVVCTNASEDGASKVFIGRKSVGVKTQKNNDLCQYDCKIFPLFSKCTSWADGKCKYDAEQEVWKGYDEGKSLGGDRYGLMKDEAYIVCIKGGGLIFAADDGQLAGDSGKAVALNIIKQWIEDSNAVSEETLREAGILASQNGVNYFTAINYKFDPGFQTHGMQVMKDMELILGSQKPYIVTDVNGNISVYPYYVGDGAITFGFGVAMKAGNLDPALEVHYKMYQYYRIVYAPGVSFSGKADTAIILKDIPPIPLEELDQMFEFVVREKFQGSIDRFLTNHGLTANQNEYDALVAMKYNMGTIPENILDAVENSKKENMSDEDARKVIYQETYNHYSTRKNANLYLKGWMDRTDKLLDLYFE